MVMEAFHTAIFLWLQQNPVSGTFCFAFCVVLSSQLVNKALWSVCGGIGSGVHTQVTMGTDKL